MPCRHREHVTFQPLLPHCFGEDFQRKILGTLPGKASQSYRRGRRLWGAESFGMHHTHHHGKAPCMLLQALQDLHEAGTPHTRSRTMPCCSQPLLMEAHIAVPCLAHRGTDAEWRCQLHCYRPQPAAGKAGLSVAVGPLGIWEGPSPCPRVRGWRGGSAAQCRGHPCDSLTGHGRG